METIRAASIGSHRRIEHGPRNGQGDLYLSQRFLSPWRVVPCSIWRTVIFEPRAQCKTMHQIERAPPPQSIRSEFDAALKLGCSGSEVRCTPRTEMEDSNGPRGTHCGAATGLHFDWPESTNAPNVSLRPNQGKRIDGDAHVEKVAAARWVSLETRLCIEKETPHWKIDSTLENRLPSHTENLIQQKARDGTRSVEPGEGKQPRERTRGRTRALPRDGATASKGSSDAFYTVKRNAFGVSEKTVNLGWIACDSNTPQES